MSYSLSVPCDCHNLATQRDSPRGEVPAWSPGALSYKQRLWLWLGSRALTKLLLAVANESKGH